MNNLLHISILAVGVALVGQFALGRVRSSASGAILLALPVGILLGANAWFDSIRDGLFLQAGYGVIALQSFLLGSRFKVGDLVRFRRHWLWCGIAALGFAVLCVSVYHFIEVETSHGLVAAFAAFFAVGLLGSSGEGATRSAGNTLTVFSLVMAGVLCAVVTEPPVGLTPTELVVVQIGLGVCAGLLARLAGAEGEWSFSATIAVILVLTGVCVWTQTPPLLAGVTAGLVSSRSSHEPSRCDRLGARPTALLLGFLCGCGFASIVPSGYGLTVFVAMVAALIFHPIARLLVARLVRPLTLDGRTALISWRGLIGRGPAGLVVALGFSFALWEPLLVWMPVMVVFLGEILAMSVRNGNLDIDRGETQTEPEQQLAEPESLEEVPA